MNPVLSGIVDFILLFVLFIRLLMIIGDMVDRNNTEFLKNAFDFVVYFTLTGLVSKFLIDIIWAANVVVK